MINSSDQSIEPERAAEQARAQSEWLRGTLASIGDAVITTDASGVVTFLNAVAEVLTGWPQAEAIGRPLGEVFQIVDEATRAAAENPAGRVLREGIVVGLANHTLLRSRQGNLIPIGDSGAPIRDSHGRIIGVVLIFRDITERRRAELAQMQLAAIVESSDDAIISKDLTGAVLSWNAGAEHMYGYTSAEMQGRSIGVIFPPERLDELAQILEQLRRGEHIAHYRTIRVRKDGQRIDISLTVSPIRDSSGAIVAASTIARDITERQRAEQEQARLTAEVEQQRRRLRQILVTVPGVVWEAWGQPDAASQRIDFVSDYVEAMLGYSVEEWLATPNFWLTIVHPDDKERAAGEAAALFASAQGGMSEFRWVAKDGRVFWVEAQSTVVCDEAGQPLGMRGITIDITARKRAEDSQRFLAQASDLLAASLDYEETLDRVAQLAVPELADWCAVHILDEDGTIRRLAVAHVDPARAAQALVRPARYPLDPNAQHIVPQVIRTGRSEMYSEVPDELLSTAARDAEHLQTLRTLGFKSYVCVPLQAHGRTLGAITLVASDSGRRYDENDLELAEELARRAAVAIENARLYSAAQEAVRARDVFLSVASHELKTPLTTLLGNAQLFLRRSQREGSLNERDGRSLRLVVDQAHRLNRMISALLDLSRLQAGQLSIEHAALDLGVLAQRVVEESLSGLDRHTLTFVPPGTSLAIVGDELRLEQVIQNLVQNAIKYSPAGGHVTVRAVRRGTMACISVTDQGIGIPQAALSRLFTRFYRAPNVDSQHISGMGVGLYVVQEIVSLHGGEVEVESQEGGGSTFTICLPLAEGV